MRKLGFKVLLFHSRKCYVEMFYNLCCLMIIYFIALFLILHDTFQNSIAQLPVEELDRIQEYLQTSGLAPRYYSCVLQPF